MKESLKKKMLKAVADVSLKAGKKDAESFCRIIYYQPKVPKELLNKTND